MPSLMCEFVTFPKDAQRSRRGRSATTVSHGPPYSEAALNARREVSCSRPGDSASWPHGLSPPHWELHHSRCFALRDISLLLFL